MLEVETEGIASVWIGGVGLVPEWLGTVLQQVGVVVVSSIAIFAAVIIVVRVNGLRSFSKMSSFDFAVTVAIGSLIASVAIGASSLLNGLIALVVIIGSQRLIARARRKTEIEAILDNTPTLLMVGDRMIDEHLARTRVTQADVRAKLRAANVLDLSQVKAVVLETTGDLSVLHGDADRQLDPDLFEGVIGEDLL